VLLNKKQSKISLVALDMDDFRFLDLMKAITKSNNLNRVAMPAALLINEERRNAFCDMLQSTGSVRQLLFSHAETLGDDRVPFTKQFIASCFQNTSLQHLSLDTVTLNVDCCQLLSHWLANTTLLTDLRLYNNHITSHGATVNIDIL
jgi:hypothetical protein